MEKVDYISHSKIGDRVTLKCFVTKELRTSKKNEPYWSLNLADLTGELFATIWQESQLFPYFETEIEDGDFLRVEGFIGEYNGAKNVDIKNIKKLEEPESFYVNIDGIKKEVRSYIKEIKDPGLQELLLRIFKSRDFADSYFRAPLSSNPNSAGSWQGGSAAFVSKLCLLIEQTADSFNAWSHSIDDVSTTLNKDFLKTLAILEPIGRVRAYKVKGNRVSYTKEGELFGIQYLTMETILEELPHIDLPDEKKQLLKHAIASIPGSQSKHSMIEDRTREAVAFNSLWNLTYQMMNFEQMERLSRNGGSIVKKRGKKYSLEEFEPYAPLNEEPHITGEAQGTQGMQEQPVYHDNGGMHQSPHNAYYEESQGQFQQPVHQGEYR